MPVEFVAAFVAAALLAIVVRLAGPLDRAARGAVSRSIVAGSGRRPEPPPRPPAVAEPMSVPAAAQAAPVGGPAMAAAQEAPADGGPPPHGAGPAPHGAASPRPIVPTRLIVSKSQADPLEPPAEASVTAVLPRARAATAAPARRAWRPSSRPGSMALQRRVAGLLTVAALLVIVVVVGYGPRAEVGEVLSATATPPASRPALEPGSAGPSAPRPTPPDVPTTPEPTQSPSPPP